MEVFERFDSLVQQLAKAVGLEVFDVYPVLAVILLGLSCGMVGSLVVCNRMAFFSDAMAHTAFAGASLALLTIILVGSIRRQEELDSHLWIVTPFMTIIGVLVGVSIAFVRERTGLTNDTVIGVFFAASIGAGTMLLPAIHKRFKIDIDQLLFGATALTDAKDILILAFLALVTTLVVSWRYNGLVFSSFNSSLARSRGINVRGENYIFIILLALVVNLSVKSVGMLLINALLVVPAAAAVNVSKNVRQVFWFTLGGSIGSSLLGHFLSRMVTIRLRGDWELEFGIGGTIIMVCVTWFFATMIYANLRSRR